MRKIVILLAALLTTAGMGFAQIVYSTGYYVNSNGDHVAAVYRNKVLLFETSLGDSYSSSLVVDLKNNNVYYVRNSEEKGDVFKNGRCFLDNVPGTCVNAISYSRGAVYSGGYCNGLDVKTAVVWNNGVTTPFYTFGDGINESEVLGLHVFNDDVVAGGYVSDGKGRNGCVWINGTVEYSHPNAEVRDVTQYDGDVYYVLVSASKAYVYCNGVELYSLNDTFLNDGCDIKVDGGDVYVTGYQTNSQGNRECCVWKNEEIICNHAWGALACLRSSYVTSEGVFYVGTTDSGQGVVYKDGEMLYSIDNGGLFDLFVPEPECGSENAWVLPFFDGFEMGETQWSCWTVQDEGNNGPYASYWHRSGKRTLMPATGDYCVACGVNADHAQEGWLVSPQMSMPVDGLVTLSFKSYEQYSGNCQYEGVWVSTTGTDPADFTEVWNGTSQASDAWKEIEIDLSDFHGRTIYIAFKYTGNNGHSWFIDNVSVETDFVPVPQYTIGVSANKPDWGSVAGGGTFDQGVSCTLIAIPNDDYQFLRWTKDGVEVSKRAFYTFTVTENANYVGVFSMLQPQTFRLTVTCDPDQGTVTGSGVYVAGTVVEISAIPNDGFVFDHWSDNNEENPREVMVNEDMTLEALFKGTGVNEQGMAVFGIYPNPVRESLRIEGLETETVVEIFNCQGMKVKTMVANSSQDISVGDLTEGLYMLRCGNQTMRFVKLK